MVFVFSVIMVWGMFLAARDVLIGWIAAVRHGRRGYLPLS